MNFDLNKLTGDDAKAIVRSMAEGFQATIQNQQSSTQKLISTVVLDLGIERTRTNPLKVSFPFVSLRVEEASDTLASCRVIPVTIDSYQDNTLLKLNDSLEFDNGISALFITNEVQAGKSMILKFYTTARVRSGSLVLANNSSPATFQIGDASAQNDGLTQLITTSLTGAIPAAGATVLGNVLQSYNNSSGVNIGTVNVGGLLGGHFKVPIGFSAEIMGVELNVSTAIASTAWAYDFLEVSDGAVFANVAALQASPSGVCNFGGINYAATTVPLKRYMNAGAANTNAISPFRGNRVFNSGKVILGIFSNYAGLTTGAFDVRLIIRLTKNVGA